MDLRRLTVFKTVAETGNMSAAASRLFISQPNVSQTIGELEEHYQEKLFERYPKKLCLTDAGKKLLTHAKIITDSFKTMENDMQTGHGRGFLQVGSTITVGNTVMSHLVSEVKNKAEWLDIYVSVENSNVIEKKILDNHLDIAVVEENINNKLLHIEPIINDCMVLVCGKEHPLTNKSSVLLNDLNGETFIIREHGSRTRALFEDVMRANNISYRVAWESSSVEAIKQAVVRNHGMAILSSRLVANELTSGDICFVPVKDYIWKRAFYLVWHKEKEITKSIELFMELARTYEKYGVVCPLTKSELMPEGFRFE